MRSIGILIALLGVLALYCIYMILNISSGQMTPDETPLDYLPSSYQVKFCSTKLDRTFAGIDRVVVFIPAFCCGVCMDKTATKKRTVAA